MNAADTQDEANNSYTRRLGRFLGRVVATIAAALLARLLGKRIRRYMHPDLNEADEDGLLQEIQLEIPVAIATIQAWNAELGAEPGADFLEHLVSNAHFMADRTEDSFARLPNNNLRWLLVNYAVDADFRVQPIDESKHYEPPRLQNT